MEEKNLTYNYFYYSGLTDSYLFYQTPKLLITDPRFKDLSSDAKLLYTLFFDLLRVSMDNPKRFTDEEGRVFIYYPIEKIMNVFNKSKPTAVKMVKELEKYGLIVKKRSKGFNNSIRIYVMDFFTKTATTYPQAKKIKTCEDAESIDSKKILPSIVKNSYPDSKDIIPSKVKTFNPNNNKDINNKTINNQSYPEDESGENDFFINTFKERFKEAIDYKILTEVADFIEDEKEIAKAKEEILYKKQLINSLFDTLVKMPAYITVSGVRYSKQEIMEKLLETDINIFDEAAYRIKNSNRKISNFGGYLVSTLISLANTYELEINNQINSLLKE